MVQHNVSAEFQVIPKEAPTLSEINMKVDDLLPFFMEKGAENEKARMLIPEVFEKIEQLRLHKLLVPKSLGGIGASITEHIDIIEKLSYADASTGWVVFASGVSTATAAGYLSTTAANHILASDARGFVAGAGGPTGVATVVDGGYLLTGKWSYGSGLLHADWSHSGAFVHENGKMRLDQNGGPEHIILHVPIADVELSGNWDVLGLRATGSVDYAISDVFVPHAHTYSPSNPTIASRPEIFGIGMMPIVTIGHAAWAAGVARRILDELANYVRTKGMRAGSLASSDSFAERFGEAQARTLSARAFLYKIWADIEAKRASLEPLSTRDITMIRLALSNMTYAAVEAGEFAYRIAGGESLRQSTMQRVYRDIHSGSQHITSSATVMQSCGRQLAGLATDEVWGINSLVKLP
ncbi:MULTISPECIES: acyl-CoA dehydrogenase family protein [Sphingobium]|uniref:acyl-CoA dehydrogenase family protein n=1 Tax=Sphingobium TaxID=165695 RepID=UPI00159BF7ED|nr:acyl-CoA dehydrogenase family protein [Sphingobium sp. 15-1]